MDAIKKILLLLLPASLLAQGIPLENLDWAPDSAYIIITKQNGEPAYEPKSSLTDGVNTDNQSITSFSYNNSNRTISISIQDGNTMSTSLNALRQILTKTGHVVQLSNSGGSINLSEYLDNTDAQVLLPITWDQASHTLTIALENGGAVSKVLDILETDPSVAAHIKSISQADIDGWNIDLVNDADHDPTNELDTLVISQPGASNEVMFTGNAMKGNYHVIRAITLGMDGTESLTIGNDNQIIETFTFNKQTGLLTLKIQNAPLKTVTLEGVGDECNDYTGLTVSSYNPPELEFWGAVDVYLNGVLMKKQSVLNHINQYNISSQSIIFYENLEASDYIRVCVK